MKNQYFGDINDYKKYGLLRMLTGSSDFGLAVCWMLTPDDSGGDGQFTSYLKDPTKWRHFDPELFDILNGCMTSQECRSIRLAESEGVLKAATFHSAELPIDRTLRRAFLEEFHTGASGKDIVFFDPDNGIEVSSVRLGSRNSNKFVYWDELIETYRAGHSMLVYQHFPRISRQQFVQQVVGEVFARIPTSLVFALSTSQVLFVLIAQPRHETSLIERCSAVQSRWQPHFKVTSFKRPPDQPQERGQDRNEWTTTIREYFSALESFATGDALARFFTPDARQVEFPNRLNPSGGESNLATLLARAEQARKILSSQHYEIVSEVAQGSRVAVEAVWTGTLAVPFGTLKAGATMRAHFAIFFDLVDGRIASQRNYDCFEPW